MKLDHQSLELLKVKLAVAVLVMIFDPLADLCCVWRVPHLADRRLDLIEVELTAPIRIHLLERLAGTHITAHHS